MELLNTIYQNADMGIKGIKDIKYKIKNPKLLKLITKEEKEYQKILKKCKHLSQKENIKIQEVSSLAKISSSIISQMKIMKEDSDNEIIKMMIKGTYKSLEILSVEVINKDDNDILELANIFIKILQDNIKELKNI